MACCDSLLAAINALNSNLNGKLTAIESRLAALEADLPVDLSLVAKEATLSAVRTTVETHLPVNLSPIALQSTLTAVQSDVTLIKASFPIDLTVTNNKIDAVKADTQFIRDNLGDVDLTAIEAKIADILRDLGEILSWSIPDRIDGLGTLINNIRGFIEDYFDWLRGLVQGLWDKFFGGGDDSDLTEVLRKIDAARSEILSAITQIPKNDAERILNALTGFEQKIGAVKDDTSEIIRRLAEGLEFDESKLDAIISAIIQLGVGVSRIPLNDAERILLALSPIRETQASHSNSLAEIIRRLAEGLEFDESKLDAIISAIIQLGVGVSRIPLNDADRILLALSPITQTQASHSNSLAEIIRRLAEGLEFDDSKLDAIIRTLIQLAVAIDRIPKNDAERILNALNGLDVQWSPLFSEMIGRLVDLAELFEHYDGLQWQPTKELAEQIWGEFEDDLSISVDLSGNCSDGSDLEEYKNPGMRGVERMLQGLAAKLEIMELNAGKSNYPIVYQPPTPEPTAANPEPEIPEPVEFCSPPGAVSYLFELINQLTEEFRILDKIYDRLGLEKFPVQVPQSLIVNTPTGDQATGTVAATDLPNDLTIESMTDLMSWFVANWEDNMGGWGKEIFVQDSNLTEEGDQSTSIILPSMSEAIAELVQLTIQNYVNSEALLQVSSRALLEAGQAKIEAIKGQRLGEAIAEYLGFEQQEKEIDIALSFNPPVDEGTSGTLEDFDNLAVLLTERTIKVPVVDNTEKIPFSDSLAKLLHAAAVIRAVYWEETGMANIGERMKGLAVRAQEFPDAGKLSADLLRNLNDPDTSNDGEGQDDFDLWLNRAELGFIDEPGISDPTNPYGRDFERRPRIRKIGNSDPSTP